MLTMTQIRNITGRSRKTILEWANKQDWEFDKIYNPKGRCTHAYHVTKEKVMQINTERGAICGRGKGALQFSEIDKDMLCDMIKKGSHSKRLKIKATSWAVCFGYVPVNIRKQVDAKPIEKGKQIETLKMFIRTPAERKTLENLVSEGVKNKQTSWEIYKELQFMGLLSSPGCADTSWSTIERMCNRIAENKKTILPRRSSERRLVKIETVRRLYNNGLDSIDISLSTGLSRSLVFTILREIKQSNNI